MLSRLLFFAGAVSPAWPQPTTVDLAIDAVAPGAGAWSVIPWDSTGNTWIAAGIGYHDWYHERSTGPDGTRIRNTAETPVLSMRGSLARDGWGIGYAMSRASTYGEWHDDGREYVVTAESGISRGGFSGWIQPDEGLRAGGWLGWPLRLHGNENAPDTEFPLILDERLGAGICLQARISGLSLVVSGSRTPVHSSMVRVARTSNAGHVDFPVVLSLSQAGVEASATLGIAGFAAKADWLELRSDTLHADAGLRFTATIPGVRVGLHETLSLPTQPYIGGECVYLSASADGFDGPQQFLRMTGTGLLRLKAQAGFLPSRRTEAGIFSDYLGGAGGEGFVDLFPFSAWTLLDPAYYRITSAFFHTFEYGIRGEGHYRLGEKQTVSASLHVSRLTLDAYLLVKEREFVFLVPTYGPTTTYELEEDVLLFRLGLRYRLILGGFSLEPALRQILPIDLNRAGSGSPGTGGESPARHSVRGGTSAEVEVRYDFPSRRPGRNARSLVWGRDVGW